MLAETEDSLRQERARGEAASEESKKLLEGDMRLRTCARV
jgi:hypothetical protein